MNLSLTFVLVWHVYYVCDRRDFANDFVGSVPSIIKFLCGLACDIWSKYKDFVSDFEFFCFSLLVVIFF